jgi:hypothetical protein
VQGGQLEQVLTSEMTEAVGTIGTSWMSTAAGPPESDSRKVSNNSIKGQQYSGGTPATAAGTHDKSISNSSRDNVNITDVNSRRETCNTRDARNSRDVSKCTLLKVRRPYSASMTG